MIRWAIVLLLYASPLALVAPRELERAASRVRHWPARDWPAFALLWPLMLAAALLLTFAL